ncbi:MAG: orotidine-5'-phosphate decarboxylase [Alphaproteobacteria bacterium]|nr:orotidine-5'-phosphate decarboxylase [Alphaproteobacteria bacterium]
MNPNPLYVALDTPDLARALQLARDLGTAVGGIKLGLEFLSAHGPDGIRRLLEEGLPVFADVKFHDIPNTVAGAARALCGLGISMFNVHASGGLAMMQAAKEAARSAAAPPKVLAVTVLTSLGPDDLTRVGQGGKVEDQVVRLAALAREAGLDGVVCSAREIAAVRKACGEDFLIVTPGIRPPGAQLGDQVRVMTPREAVRAGADILVVGRPLTGAANPAEVALSMLAEIKSVSG